MLRRLFGALVIGSAVAAMSGACAGGNGAQVDPCKRALERLVDECGYEADGIEGLDTHCTGQSACIAGCLETSPCEDISKNNGEFSDCTAGCQ